MPLTEFQSEVLRLLARNREIDSYFAGGVVINIEGPRISKDFDLFHDREEQLAAAVRRDEQTLQEAGYQLSWAVRMPSFHRASILAAGDDLLLEWALDSDFRFFPVQRDERFGYRLHLADIATNKILAAAGRREPRDIVDLLTLHARLLPVGYLAWAAAAKDPGLTPAFILNELMRTGLYQQSELDELAIPNGVSASDVNMTLRRIVEEARLLISRLPSADVGCLYLDGSGKPVAPELDQLESYRRHFGVRGGHWPSSSVILSSMVDDSADPDDRA